ncbi:resistance to inhibitors of cholinesterase protein 3-like isoform X2 [Gigantopelta aegis]|uniref:resistance to inhibitors of cholinesterase protein 3-like isoform X2 n=1 Tax=Gigantopelta aegis TaxID=1735272 RepID=UPI001B8895D8|nr:resistance to inhibitors of cholinesterase protein 3-like isoform X2 [Gigantopelta aegis]
MSIKTFATFAIIIGCFAVLYPRFLSPMFNHLLGFNQKKTEEKQAQFPPGFNKAMGGKPEMAKPQIPDDIRQHLRAGPHPGLRAAAEMGRTQAQHGSGRGMMGIVLPMYAVGIVLYLVYTLVKVFNKKDPSQDRDRDRFGYRPSGLGSLYDNRDGNFTYGDDFSNPETLHNLIQSKRKQQELEDLLVRSDDQNITATEMRELQRRLEETEAQMSKILFAMKNVSTKVDGVAEETGPVQTNNEEESPDDKKSTKTATTDSSPDMESYEIVKNSADSSPVMESVGRVDISPEIDDKAAELTSPEPAVKSASGVTASPEIDDNTASEDTTCPESIGKFASEDTMNPETLIPEEMHKSDLGEIQDINENPQDANENATDGSEMGGDEKEQEVLMEKKLDEDEEHTNVRLRKLPAASQD